MSADTQLVDYKGNIINPGDKIIMAMNSTKLIERIYIGTTKKSFVFSKYSFAKDLNRQTVQVPAYWTNSRTYTKRVDKDVDIMEHNMLLYRDKEYFNKQSILLLEIDSEDINPDLRRYVKKDSSSS